MSKKSNNSQHTETNNTTPPAEKKTRVRRDHSNEFKLFVIKLVPGSSFIAVTNQNKITGLYGITSGTNRNLVNKMNDTFAMGYAASVCKQRNGPKADAVVTLPTSTPQATSADFAMFFINSVMSNVLFDYIDEKTTPATAMQAVEVANEINGK